MSLLLLMVELASFGAVVSATAWLRHRAGVRDIGFYPSAARYILPFFATFFFVLAAIMAVDWLEGYRSPSFAPSWGWVLVFGVFLTLALAQLVLAARRYRARPPI